ncbi:hypothetical protein E3U43_007828 [Larimichthys crocea]|uniref:Uncharacterized protein n=1 Tax=Larimichthys crocea TaxID=215358 RepID=A0ACD3Q6X5_LARCR|nr:hypothetical protein E3U43_007828 [Larimichthys crocea]
MRNSDGSSSSALSSSRGVAGVKGLFFIFTVLCLVCFVSSLIEKDELKKLKQKVQKAEQELDWQKAERAFTSEVMNYYSNLMDPLTALVKKTTKGLPDDFPPLDGLMDNLKVFIEKTKSYVDAEYAEEDEEMENTEQELKEMKKLIKSIEDFQAEL